MSNKKISQALARATCTLLGLTTNVSQANNPWEVEFALLNYNEQGRNNGVEAILNARQTLADGDVLGLTLEIDTLTGATPNGASPTNRVQTFTQSSGYGSYTVKPDTLPADDTHMDTRMSIELDYEDQLTERFSVGYSGGLSMEFDFLSFGAGNRYEIDLNQGNTSLFFGINGEYNRVHPVGNVPDPLALMTAPDSIQNRNVASITRRTAEAAIGVTQVIDRKSLYQVRLIRSRFDGYLNDPYKILSIIEDQNGSSLGSTLAYRFENRPDSRYISTLFLAYKRDLGAGIFDLSLRHSSDDWDIQSNTVDMRYRYKLNAQGYWQPQLRFYRQQAAYFYRHSLPNSEGLPSFASADTRLAAFDAITIGIKYGSQVIDNKQHSVSFEYYTQRGDSHPSDAVGLQNQQDLFPTLNTLLLKYIYRTQW